jgi:hypothetical protein
MKEMNLKQKSDTTDERVIGFLREEWTEKQSRRAGSCKLVTNQFLRYRAGQGQNDKDRMSDSSLCVEQHPSQPLRSLIHSQCVQNIWEGRHSPQATLGNLPSKAHE